jgi:hypothetical protein
MQLLIVERSVWALLRAFVAAVRGKLGGARLAGVHLERGDEIRIEGDRSNVILDGELFQAINGAPIVLRPTPPVAVPEARPLACGPAGPHVGFSQARGQLPAAPSKQPLKRKGPPKGRPFLLSLSQLESTTSS